MDEHEWLADQFESQRARLRAVAYRMLGSASEADDAVQESWLRLSRSKTSEIDNLGGWLTTVIARVCLDMLRVRSRVIDREEPLAIGTSEMPSRPSVGVDPEHEAMLADSVGPALLVVLDMLSPAERLAFVLHDMFAVPFDEIGPILGRTPDAARQLASRARRRVQGTAVVPDADIGRQREVVDAFLAASRGGDFEALLAVLDPDVVARADGAAVAAGAQEEVRGAPAVAETFAGRAKAAQPALVDGSVGLVWLRGGEPQVVFDLTIVDGKIIAIDLLADAGRVAELELVVL